MRASGGVFHNRTLLNDSTLLGGNPPFQPMVTLSNGSVDNPSGGGAGGTDLPFGMQAQDVEFKHPTSYMWSTGVQREVPFGFIVDVTYVGRRGLYLPRERNINQLQPGTIGRNPGVNIAALRPYKGYGVLRLTENAARSMYNSLQLSVDRRYSNGLKVGLAYTLGKSTDNGSDKRNVLWDPYDDTIYEGPSNFDRRHALSIYYIYDLPFWREPTNLAAEHPRRLADLGRGVHADRHAIHNHPDGRSRRNGRRQHRPADRHDWRSCCGDERKILERLQYRRRFHSVQRR